MGTPVVTTSVGKEGIDANHETHLLIADTPETFAQSIIRLMKNPVLAEQLSENGKKLVREKYSLEAVGGLWENLLLAEIESFKRRPK